ncbi:MAG: Mov34/MPN/PAD-1 family protein [Egibacteraceae bacterium]
MTRARIAGRLDLDHAMYEAMIAHARSDPHFEVCGLLATEDGRVVRHYKIPNAKRSATFFLMDPVAHKRAYTEIEDHDWGLVIYHSHTHTEAFPSPTDVEQAWWYPDAVYLIVSLQDVDAPVIRGFDIIDGTITERVLYIDGEEAPVGRR